jgi:hypothetical protein
MHHLGPVPSNASPAHRPRMHHLARPLKCIILPIASYASPDHCLKCTTHPSSQCITCLPGLSRMHHLSVASNASLTCCLTCITCPSPSIRHLQCIASPAASNASPCPLSQMHHLSASNNASSPIASNTSPHLSPPMHHPARCLKCILSITSNASPHPSPPMHHLPPPMHHPAHCLKCITCPSPPIMHPITISAPIVYFSKSLRLIQ